MSAAAASADAACARKPRVALGRLRDAAGAFSFGATACVPVMLLGALLQGEFSLEGLLSFWAFWLVVGFAGWLVLFLPLALMLDSRSKWSVAAWAALAGVEALLLYRWLTDEVEFLSGRLGWSIALTMGIAGGACHGVLRLFAQGRIGWPR